MRFNKISLKDKAVFDKYLNLTRHELSVYAFLNIYIWKALFDIEWAIIEKTLCVFFKDKFGSFLYLPPLSAKENPKVIKKCFNILDGRNINKDISRIENIEEKDAPFYENLGYDCKNKFSDYLCKREELSSLSGNKFKSKRASCNYFLKHYQFEYLPFTSREGQSCLRLYDIWMEQRKAGSPDNIYQWMLQDSRHALQLMLKSSRGLNLAGKVVKINKEIKAFTFGFKLNNNTFCILYEITDLSIKGLAQFIFARFCQELKDYKYINIMDDSGLESLKK